MSWFPNNNVPFDKATFTIAMSVPDDGVQGFLQPWSVVGTGVLRGGAPTIAGGKRRYVWETSDLTAPYLASVSIARFDLVTTTSTNPPVAPTTKVVPFYAAIDSAFLPMAKATQLTNLNRTSSILDFYAGYYDLGYPFDAQGGINPLQSVGYSLETQGKPTYAINASPASTGASIDTIAHENGHMYFGDYVTLTRWKDIWLNEGMTEFSTWLWQTTQPGQPTLPERFADVYATTDEDFWLIPTADPPTGADVFDANAMYVRGATTMVAVHEILGDAAFRTLMHDWLTAPGHAYGNATTEEFIALVQAHDPAHAARWTTFFQQWLYTSYSGTPSPSNRPQVTPSTF
jgi:aminopeptidase N